MITLITTIHILVSIVLMLVVLLQTGKGGGMGIAFGSSGAQQVFGGRGAGGLLEKITAGCAVVFMLTSVGLAYHASQNENSRLEQISNDKKKAAAAEKAKEDAQNLKAKQEAEEALKKAAPAQAPAAPTTTPAPTPAPAK